MAFHDPDNNDGVITHLEADILECEVKWALGSITKTKASGGDGIPVELFQILKDDTVKVLHSICQQNLENSAVATGLEKVSFHSNPKERQCQRMFKLQHSCTHFTCYESNPQNFPQFLVIHTVKGFGIVNKAEIDIFLELSCFFHDPEDVGNLISGSSAFSKTTLNIWKFTVHVLLKPGLENFEHYFTSV